MYNKVILVGNLTRNVELKYTPAGTAVATFGIATNRTFKDSVTGENKQETMFIDVQVFGRSAEIANQYLRKGKRVLIEGRLVLNSWVASDGSKRHKHYIVAEKVQFMDKKEEDTAAPSSYQQQPQSQPQPAPQNNNIPQVDIDDEDIPF